MQSERNFLRSLPLNFFSSACLEQAIEISVRGLAKLAGLPGLAGAVTLGAAGAGLAAPVAGGVCAKALVLKANAKASAVSPVLIIDMICPRGLNFVIMPNRVGQASQHSRIVPDRV